MKEAALDKLVEAGTIESYYLDVVNEEGQVGFKGKCRNTQKLHLVFPDGNTLTIDTYCSGCMEDSGFILESHTPSQINNPK